MMLFFYVLSQRINNEQNTFQPILNDSDSEEPGLLSDDDKCCVCGHYAPPALRNFPFLKIVNWAGCSSCNHWVHLKFCTTTEITVRRNNVFLCVHCLEE